MTIHEYGRSMNQGHYILGGDDPYLSSSTILRFFRFDFILQEIDQ